MADRPGNIQLNRTTAFRLSIRYAIGFCLLTIIALVLVYVHILSNVNRQINAGLRAEIQSLALSWQASGTAALTRTIHARSSQASIDATDQGDAGPRLYLLVSASGKRLAGALPHWREALSQQGDNTLDTIMLHTPQALLHLVEDRPVFKLRSYQTILADGSRLLVAQALNEQAELRAELLKLIAIVIMLMLGAGIVGGWWIGNTVVRSLESVTRAAGRIMAGDLSQRIPDTRLSDEFALLAQKLNQMLGRIETLMNDLREVTVNVAHDMRTPLTRLRTHAEMALLQADDTAHRQALQTSIQESEKLVQMLDAIVNIARVEAEPQLAWQTHDLCAICRDAVDFYQPLIEDKQQQLVVNLPDTALPVPCNPQLLAQALGNLLDNAIKYTPAAGTIELSLSRQDRQVHLVVADNGPGIPEPDRMRATRRFVRLDNSRSLPGNGMGLALVAAIIERHSGSLLLDDNDPGLKVNLFLPLS